MCGILGVYSKKEINENLAEELGCAAKIISHRGPDNTGCWKNENVVMFHNKLSILDFSSNSNQPIETENVILTLNGEIYNYKDLIVKYGLNKNLIDAHILVFLYEKFGIEFLNYIEGDFAISIYDKVKNKMFLCRDRLGVKPLLYTVVDDKIFYTSEIKAFYKISDISLKPDIKRIVDDFVLSFWAEKEHSYFENVFYVNPGEYLEIDKNLIKKKTYWDINVNVKNSEKYFDEMKAELEDATYRRTMGEAKYASLLSGGLDSSLLTAICASKVDKLTSFTIKYEKEENNLDLEFAKSVVEKYPNINHKINFVKRDNITLPLLDKLTWHMEEILWDKVYFSMWTNYHNARKNGYRIIINGQGSDEIWAGYYYDFEHYKYNKEKFYEIDEMYNLFYKTNVKYGKIFTEDSVDSVKNSLKKIASSYITSDDTVNDICKWAAKTYLISNLMQEDRMSMAESVECRVPFTSYKFVEKAFEIKGEEKIKNNIEKFPVKQISYSYLPEKLANRRKQAFVNPSKTYNKIAQDYLKENWNAIATNTYFKQIFNKEFLKTFINDKEMFEDGEFCWKLFALHRFFVVHERGGNINA